MKRSPFEKDIATMEELRDRIEQLSGAKAAGDEGDEIESDSNSDSMPKTEKKT